MTTLVDVENLAEDIALQQAVLANQIIEAQQGLTANAAAIAAEISRVQAEEQVGLATAQAVLTANDRVQTGLDRVQTGLDVIASEAARDAAIATGKIYATTAAGLAATTTGQYFNIVGATDTSYVDLYLNSSGSAVFQKSYPTIKYLTDRLVDSAPLDMSWSVVDSANKAAIGVTTDGTFLAKTASIDTATINTLNATTIVTPLVTATVVALPNASVLSDPVLDLAWAVTDSTGKAAIGVRSDGALVTKKTEAQEVQTANLTVHTINGQAYVSGGTGTVINRAGGVYPYQMSYISCFGQSLAEGSQTGLTDGINLTTAQEYDNIGFAGRANAPTQTYALTVANTQVGTRGESPIYGTLGHIKELILEENGLAYAYNDFQLVGCCNGWSGYPIDSLKKNTLPYNYVISQATAGTSIAAGLGKTFGCIATTYMQGEANEAMDPSLYVTKEKQLAVDFNTDIKAATGQKQDIPFITYQVGTGADGGYGVRSIALAQLQAANESHLIYMACPMYQFDYYDQYHINATSAKWVGGYLGLAIKRIVVDKVDWQPLKPVTHIQSGTTLDLVFNKDGLVLDTTLVPAQTNHGFQVLDSGGSAITISSIVVLSPNRVRFTLATAPTAGAIIRYGFANATGKGAYIGGCGNLRDSQGDTIIYSAINKPMHNWCVIFSYTI